MSVGLYLHHCCCWASRRNLLRLSQVQLSRRRWDRPLKAEPEDLCVTNLQEVLSDVRESHRDLSPRNAATACHRLAKYVGKNGNTIESGQDEATLQLAIQAAKRTASRMNYQEVSIRCRP